MCIGCRQRRSKDTMMRLIMDADGTVQADVSERHGGRGAWLCPNPQCLHKILRRNGFRQAFRRSPRNATASELHAQFGTHWTARAQRRVMKASRLGAMRPINAVDGHRIIQWGTPPKAWEVTDDHWLNRIKDAITHARDWHEMAAGTKQTVSATGKHRC